MKTEQTAAFNRMLTVETAIRWTRDSAQRDWLSREWKRLQTIVDGR